MNKPKVFLAEDNQSDGFLLDLAFTEAGRSVEIVQAHDGDKAFELLRAAACQVPFPFRLIILDLNLPKVDGLELLLGLQGWPELTRVARVILTTAPTTRERERVQDLHCVLLVKPEDYSGYSALIATLVPYLFPTDAGLPVAC